jgi:hypothetical protein
MANEKVKTEMHGTGGGRWCLRAVAKQSSKKLRRESGKKACRDAKASA